MWKYGQDCCVIKSVEARTQYMTVVYAYGVLGEQACSYSIGCNKVYLAVNGDQAAWHVL